MPKLKSRAYQPRLPEAGRRDRLIVIERRISVQEGIYGTPTVSWTEYASAWADVNFGTGRERREGVRFDAEVPATFRMPWSRALNEVTPKDRLFFNDVYWDISSIVPLGRDGIEIVGVAKAEARFKRAAGTIGGIAVVSGALAGRAGLAGSVGSQAALSGGLIGRAAFAGSVGAAAGLAGELNTYEPESIELFSRMTVQPDATRKGLINTLIKALKTAGVWTKMEAFYVLAAHDAQAARRNWIRDLYNCAAVNSPSFTADRGYTGDGSSSYLDTNFNPTTASSPKMVQNSAHMGFWSRTSADSFVNDMGATGVLFIGARNSGNMNGRIFAGGNTGIANANGTGHYVGSRTGALAADVIAYKNGASIGSPNAASTAPQSGNIFIGARSVAAQFSARQISAAHFGSGLTAQNTSDVYNALAAYMTAVGA